MAKKKNDNDLVNKRRAFHDYEILETYEAGIALKGTEIKSLRSNSGSLQDAYVTINENELWLVNSSIAPYSHGNVYNHEEKRKRKLLMHRREIDKLHRQVQEKGLTLVPLALYLKKGRVKVKIALGKGKKKYDKRESMKEKEHKKSIQKELDRSQ